MKKIVVCSLLFVVCFGAFAQRDTVLLSKADIDFGIVKGLVTPKASVWLYNKGKTPLTIKYIIWGADYCPCLYGKNLTVAPNDSFLITIQCMNVSLETTFSRTMSVSTSRGLYHVNYKGEFEAQKPKTVTPPEQKK